MSKNHNFNHVVCLIIYNINILLLYNSRNQDSGKVFYLEKQEYVDSCGTHVFRLLLAILANLSFVMECLFIVLSLLSLSTVLSFHLHIDLG